MLVSGNVVGLRSYGLKWYVEFVCVFLLNLIVCKDGIVYGLDGFMIFFWSCIGVLRVEV